MIIRPLTIMAEFVDPLNPLGLPPYTIRVKYTDGSNPSGFGTKVQVSQSPNVWDITYETNDWQGMLSSQASLLEVLGANTTGVTNMTNMFYGCMTLTTIPLFDTSNVTNMSGMLFECMSLTNIPLLNTSKATNMQYMFANCTNVQSGALALYQQASSQANPPSNHNRTFMNCGRDTTTGAAELAQIPSSWK